MEVPNGTSTGPESDGYDDYDFNHKRRGVALIICNGKFLNEELDRPGAKQDQTRLKEACEKLGFKVRLQPDLTAIDIEKEVRKLSEEDHSDCDCVLVAISSHGRVDGPHVVDEFITTVSRCDGRGEGDQNQNIRRQTINQEILTEIREAKDIVAGTDGIIAVQDLMEMFYENPDPKLGNKSLVGKPKIFILQCCRGDKYMTTTTYEEETPVTPERHDDSDEGPSLPDPLPTRSGQDQPSMAGQEIGVAVQETSQGSAHTAPPNVIWLPAAFVTLQRRNNPLRKDFIAITAVPEGYFAIHKEGGSPFIRYLCYGLQDRHQDVDLITLLTEVSEEIAKDVKITDGDGNESRFVPCVRDMLVKQVCFTPKDSDPASVSNESPMEVD